MKPWIVTLLGFLGLGLAAVASRPAPSVVVQTPPPKGAQVWSLAPSRGTWCGLPIVPRCTDNFGATVLEVGGSGPVWGWTPPGDLRAADIYGDRLIADVELRDVTPAAPASAWTGAELAEAAALALRVGGVTSHGFVPAALRPVFALFAARNLVGYPQVYDSDRSTEPRAFLRTCVASWKKAGFTRIVPLLGASAGPDYLQAWFDECRELGLVAHVWSLQRCEERGIGCAELGVG